jgi:nucleoside-diphosphate-sugar epimerase
MKILVTGATGFLGSHIAENLLLNGFELILTKRNNSDLKNCNSFLSKVVWVNTDSNFWIDDVIQFNPTVIIHAAWNGVSSSKREDWNSQLSNLDFLYHLLKIHNKCHIRKFIALGSQAEYGQLEGKITEEYPLNPTSSYGAMKLSVLELLKLFCNENNIDWFWLRVFSIFGEREDEKWLIPSVIKKMLSKSTEMDFTLGEQKYAYLYVGDFAESITKVVKTDGPSGIYNISSDKPLILRDLLLMIRNNINPHFELKFGALPYRLNQPMHIEGDITKFNNTFGPIDNSAFDIKLKRVINSYVN